MTELIRLQYQDYSDQKRIKLISLLLSESMFLRKCYYKTSNNKEKKAIEKGMRRLDNILNKLMGDKLATLTTAEYKKLIKKVYKTMNRITKKIN
ncbi:MAG: hypothetical protein GF383_10445 [Candidatus Lokiarchaeota archaeon]|nr:hypothetical protein [Candidatus Lokiarchaeota archaeon]MBD3340980.1 hypothetical protein [Candidatus Lokiarchaeota archaeon]